MSVNAITFSVSHLGRVGSTGIFKSEDNNPVITTYFGNIALRHTFPPNSSRGNVISL
jgi:hypothetical protein